MSGRAAEPMPRGGRPSRRALVPSTSTGDLHPRAAAHAARTPFVRLARTLRRYCDGLLAVITLGISSARLQGLHSKVRLLSHRKLRLSLRRFPDRAHLPLLRRTHHYPAAVMTHSNARSALIDSLRPMLPGDLR
jgi:hypothetical protein